MEKQNGLNIPRLMDGIRWGRELIALYDKNGEQVPVNVYKRQLELCEKLIDMMTGGEQK